MDLFKKTALFIKENQLLTQKQPIIVGVSGGADSMVLLYLLRYLGYECVVAHCNFTLRGTESDDEERFLREYARKGNLAIEVATFETAKYAQKHKISIEMAARTIRYEWFEMLRSKYEAQAVAVAHHGNDSVETMLINLVRGSGLHGLTGIKARNENIVRPLLNWQKQEILTFAQNEHIPYVTDSSNLSNDYVRNRFRNEIVPLLEEINPAVKQTLLNTISRLQSTEQIFNERIAEYQSLLMKKQENFIEIDAKRLLTTAEPTTILFELIKTFGYNADIITDILKAVVGRSGAVFHSPTHTLLVDRDTLQIKQKTADNQTDVYENVVENGNVTIFSPIELHCHIAPKLPNFNFSKSPNLINIDADCITFPLTIRRWRKGDSFSPIGMDGKRKKLSDFFIDQKFSIFQKENCWLLLSKQKIVWVIGYRIDDSVKITANTQNILTVRVGG